MARSYCSIGVIQNPSRKFRLTRQVQYNYQQWCWQPIDAMQLKKQVSVVPRDSKVLHTKTAGRFRLQLPIRQRHGSHV